MVRGSLDETARIVGSLRKTADVVGSEDGLAVNICSLADAKRASVHAPLPKWIIGDITP